MTPVVAPETITLPEGLSATAALIVTAILASIPLISFFADLMSNGIRKRTAAGEKVSPVLLGFAAVLNFLSVNLLKGIQLFKMAQGKPVASTDPSTSAPPVPGGITLVNDNKPKV